jgi:hypothetical protein
MPRSFNIPSFCHPNTVTRKITKFKTPTDVREYAVIAPTISIYNIVVYVEQKYDTTKGKQIRGLPRKNCVNSEPGEGLLVVV